MPSAGESISLQGNDETSGRRLERVFREHYARVVAVLVRMTGDRAHSEEIASDVFCKLAQRPENAENAVPWLYRVAANAGLDAIRTRVRRNAWNAETPVLSNQENDALEALLVEEKRECVRTALASMKPRDAELLLLRAEGLSYKQLSAALGVAPGSIGTLLVRAEGEFEKRYSALEGRRGR